MNQNSFTERAAIALCMNALIAMCAQAASLHQVGSFSLEGVKGRIDHLTYDSNRHRLFVAALGNNTVEVIDTTTGSRLKTIRGESEPQGVKFVQDGNVLVVAAGAGGAVDFYDGDTLTRTKSATGYRDADNVRYDASSKQVIVGWGDGALTWFKLPGEAVATVRLPAHPESFQIHPGKSQIYVNIPGKGSVVTVDGSSTKLVDTWPIRKASGNYPMCLNADGTQFFVACRQPPQIITYDTANGEEVSRVGTSGDADDIFYDSTGKRLYESCGEGYIDVFQDAGNGHLQRIERTRTAGGARTSLYVDELKKLFLAVPSRTNQKCEIRVFQFL